MYTLTTQDITVQLTDYTKSAKVKCVQFESYLNGNVAHNSKLSLTIKSVLKLYFYELSMNSCITYSILYYGTAVRDKIMNKVCVTCGSIIKTIEYREC